MDARFGALALGRRGVGDGRRLLRSRRDVQGLRARRLEVCAHDVGARRERRTALGTIREKGSLVVAEIATRQLDDVVRASHEHALEVPLANLPVAEDLPLGEVVRLPLHVFEAPDPARFRDTPRALDLEQTHALVPQATQLVPRGVECCGCFVRR